MIQKIDHIIFGITDLEFQKVYWNTWAHRKGNIFKPIIPLKYKSELKRAEIEWIKAGKRRNIAFHLFLFPLIILYYFYLSHER